MLRDLPQGEVYTYGEDSYVLAPRLKRPARTNLPHGPKFVNHLKETRESKVGNKISVRLCHWRQLGELNCVLYNQHGWLFLLCH